MRNKKGERAILTYIPKESLVYRTLESGKTYKGRAMVVGNWNITRYEPIMGPGGKLIGAFYVGIPAPRDRAFRDDKASKAGRARIHVCY